MKNTPLWLTIVVGLVVVVGNTLSADALVFTPPRPVGNLAGVDAGVQGPLLIGDASPAVAAGDNGTWIVVWRDQDIPGAENNGFIDIVYSRSTDGGATWSGPQYIYSSPASEVGTDPAITTDGNGTWGVAYLEHGSSGGVKFVRSVDDGLSWSSPVMLSLAHTTVELGTPSMDTDRHGTWVLSWACEYLGTDPEICFVGSADNGASWSAEQFLNSDASSDLSRESYVNVSSDWSGNWVAVWARGSSTVASRSSDNGLTWAAPVLLGGGFISPQVTTDRIGRWMAVWATDWPLKHAYSSYSTDAGGTWSSPAAVVAASQDIDTLNQLSPSLVYLGHGRWTIGLMSAGLSYGNSIGKDADLEFVESFDGGQSWDAPSLLNTNGRKDGEEIVDSAPDLATDGLGRTIAVWMSNDDLGGTIGNDFDILFSVAQPDCPVSPRGDCASAGVASSRLSIKNGPGGKDRMKWTWRGGSAVTAGSLGDPTTTSSYALCVYANVGGTMHAVMDARAEAGATCSGLACWAASGEQFTYKDSQLTRGALRQLSLRPGAEGKASVQLKLSGPSTGPPSMPISTGSPVQAQLINLESDACWDATFSIPSTNDANRYSATSD